VNYYAPVIFKRANEDNGELGVIWRPCSIVTVSPA
jgi:hypothetical protein